MPLSRCLGAKLIIKTSVFHCSSSYFITTITKCDNKNYYWNDHTDHNEEARKYVSSGFGSNVDPLSIFSSIMRSWHPFFQKINHKSVIHPKIQNMSDGETLPPGQHNNYVPCSS